MFKHDLIVRPDALTDELTPSGRFYTIPDGRRFPSVTTVLSWHKGKDWRTKWEKRVGKAEADRIVGEAQVRGTSFHELAEKYVLNDKDWRSGSMPVNSFTFDPIRRLLDKHLGTVYAVEYPVWSDVLMTAGRFDLFADWDGVPSIIDFKTSRRIKKEEHVLSYLVQKTAYALMLYERTGIKVKQIVTLMAVDHESPQVFVRPRRDYDHLVQKIFIEDRLTG